MKDDQKISQSVDNVMAETPDSQSGDHHDQSSTDQTAYSLGSNPSSASPVMDNSSTGSVIQPSAPPADDGLVTVDRTNSSSSSDLDDIKQQALSQLSPIISELDQSPEEKFSTLMMLIQASDDKSLIKNAFEAANSIEDKKAKAKALLNIVNEINYFSASQSTEKADNQEETL